MQEYINEYQNINGEFASIISKSLEADNLQVHAKAASFMDDFQQWIELLSDSYEVILILSILVYTLFSRMFDLMQPPAVKHSIAVV